MESYSQAIGLGFLLPAIASFICLIVVARWTSGRGRALAGALTFVVVILCYHFLGLGPLRPAENWQWLPWLGLSACLVEAVSPNKWILWILYSLFAILAAWLLVPDVERLADVRSIWLVALPLLLLMALASTILLGQILHGPALPFWLLLASLAGVFLVFFASLAKFAQLGGILAGMLVGCLAAAWWKPTRGVTAAIAPGWAALWSGLILEAKLASFSETPLASFLLVLGAPLTIWLTLLPPVRKMNPVWRTALGALLLAIPAAVGLYLAGKVAMSDMEEW